MWIINELTMSRRCGVTDTWEFRDQRALWFCLFPGKKWGEGVAEGWETKAKQLGQSLGWWHLWNKVVLHSVGLHKLCSILVEIMPLAAFHQKWHYAEVSESELGYNLTFSLCSGKLAAAQIHSTFSTLDQACKSCKNSSQSRDLHITKSGGNKWMFPRLRLLITRRPALLPSIFYL